MIKIFFKKGEIKIFTQKLFTNRLLGARGCSGHWEYSDK